MGIGEFAYCLRVLEHLRARQAIPQSRFSSKLGSLACNTVKILLGVYILKRVLLSFCLFGAILSAGTVNVSFQSANPVVTVPTENGAWAGPYTLNVNGTSLLAMCMDDFRGVNGTWTANVTSLASSDLSKTVLGNSTTNIFGYQLTSSDMYKIEAVLFQQLIQPGADRANLQLAAWALMNPATLTKVVNSNNTIVENDLIAAYGNIATVNGANYAILSDVGGRNQEFMIGVTGVPEPSTFTLLAAALFAAGVSAFLRRKQVAK